MTIDINVQGDDKTTYKKGMLFKMRVLVCLVLLWVIPKALPSAVVARGFKHVCSDINTIPF